MSIISWVSSARMEDRRFFITLLAAPIVALLGARLVREAFNRTSTQSSLIYKAPRLSPSAHENASTPYPTNAIPGARDVDTPYGSIRVYEWGPLDGRKVLFVHGISTPCVAFASMAQQLVDEYGCRVMLFDLFGRGYSDTPDPHQYEQDVRLWTTQILLVLASSKLSWTGKDGGFALIGYSLGGGISAAFTSYFPQLVKSLVLIAPAGLLRPTRVHWTSRLLYGGWLPHFVVDRLVGGRLRGTPLTRTKGAGGGNPEATAPRAAAAAEIPDDDHPAHALNSTATLDGVRPGISVADVVEWQLDQHPGFVSAFVSSIKHSPISDQHEPWGLIGKRLKEARNDKTKAIASDEIGERSDKVLLLLGKTDAVIVPDETSEDATAAIGAENLRVSVLEGGHDVPIVNSTGCVSAIVDFWEET